MFNQPVCRSSIGCSPRWQVHEVSLKSLSCASDCRLRSSRRPLPLADVRRTAPVTGYVPSAALPYPFTVKHDEECHRCPPSRASSSRIVRMSGTHRTYPAVQVIVRHAWQSTASARPVHDGHAASRSTSPGRLHACMARGSSLHWHGLLLLRRMRGRTQILQRSATLSWLASHVGMRDATRVGSRARRLELSSCPLVEICLAGSTRAFTVTLIMNAWNDAAQTQHDGQ